MLYFDATVLRRQPLHPWGSGPSIHPHSAPVGRSGAGGALSCAHLCARNVPTSAKLIKGNRMRVCDFSEHLQIPGIASNKPHVKYHNIKKGGKQPQSSRKLQGRVKREQFPGRFLLFNLSFYVPHTRGGHLHAKPGTTGGGLAQWPRPPGAQSSVWPLGDRETYQQRMSLPSDKCCGQRKLELGPEGQSDVGQPKCRAQSPDGESPPTERHGERPACVSPVITCPGAG